MRLTKQQVKEDLSFAFGVLFDGDNAILFVGGLPDQTPLTGSGKDYEHGLHKSLLPWLREKGWSLRATLSPSTYTLIEHTERTRTELDDLLLDLMIAFGDEFAFIGNHVYLGGLVMPDRLPAIYSDCGDENYSVLNGLHEALNEWLRLRGYVAVRNQGLGHELRKISKESAFDALPVE